MSTKKYLDDLNEIKNLMNRSSRFISLSGLSGVLAGVYALLGSYFAYQLLYSSGRIYDNYTKAVAPLIGQLSIIAIAILFSTLLTAYFLTRKKAKQNNEKIWDETTKRLLINFLVPLSTGGAFGLILLNQGFIGFIAPVTLIFYGLSLVNASKFTLDNIKYLGYSEIILGLISTIYIGYGLYFWAIGFGILHIVYGGMMYIIERKKQL